MRASRRSAAGSTEAAKFAKSGSAYVVATVAPILSTFAVTPFVVRALGVHEYGVVGIGITVYQLGLVLLSLGLPAAITRHAIVAGNGPAGASALVVVGAGMSGVLGAVAAVTASAWGGLLLPDDQSAAVLAAPACSAIGLSALMLAQSFLRGVDRVRAFVLLGMLAAVLPPATGLTAITVGAPSADVYLWSIATVHLVVGAASVLLVSFLARPRLTAREFGQSLWIGSPTVPHQMSTSLLTAVLVASAGSLVSIAAAGYLQLALLLGTAPMVLIGAFNNAWAPMVYRADADRARVLRDSTTLVAVLSLLLVGLYGAVAPLLAFLLGGAGADSIAAPSLVAAVGAPLMVVYLSHIHLVFLRGRTWPLALTTPASTLIAIGTTLWLTHAYATGDLRLFALAIPVFYVCQVVSASLLARGTGYEPPDVRPSLLYLVPAALLPTSLALWPEPSWLVGAGALLLALLIAALYLVTMRRSARRVA